MPMMTKFSMNQAVLDGRVQVREHKKKRERSSDVDNKVSRNSFRKRERLQALHHNEDEVMADEAVRARTHVHTVTKSGMTDEPLRNCAMARSTLDWIVRKPELK
jgi:hypothetical protein